MKFKHWAIKNQEGKYWSKVGFWNDVLTKACIYNDQMELKGRLNRWSHRSTLKVVEVEIVEKPD
jgi:hypothetical protein